MGNEAPPTHLERAWADYAELVALATRETPPGFFARLHRLFQQRCDAVLMTVVTADGDGGARTYYQGDLRSPGYNPDQGDLRSPGYPPDGDEAVSALIVDPTLVARAVEADRPLAFEPSADGLGAPTRPDAPSVRSLIVAPIRSSTASAAFLAVASPKAGAFGQPDLDYAAAAAGVCALVLELVEARDEADTRGDEIRLLLQTARALSSERDLNKMFARVHELVRGVIEADSFFIALGSSETGRLEYPYAVDRGTLAEVAGTAIDDTLAGHVFRVGKPVLVSSSSPLPHPQHPQHPQPQSAAATTGERTAASAIYAPMRIGEVPIGVVSVQSARPSAYSERDRDLLVAIAEQTAIAVENSHYFLRAEQRALELRLLAEISRVISTQLSLRMLCQTVGREVRRVMDAPIFFVALKGGDGALHIQYHIEGDAEQELSESSIESAIAERVMKFLQPVVLQTPASQAGTPLPYLEQSEQVVRSIVMAPLRIGRQCLGVLSAQSYRDGAYEEASSRLLTAIGEQMALAIQNAQLYGEAQARADRDPLTNLYHHRYLKTRLEEEIERARRASRPLALLMLDLDHFKEVNDTYGHLAGDEALKLMTSVLAAACRTSDVVGRYGGDEFMVIFPEADLEQGVRVADRIELGLSGRKLRLESGEELELRASMGLATFPEDASNATDLVAKADAGLYEAKRQGRRLGRLQRFGKTHMRLVGEFEPVAELIGALVGRDAAARRRVERDNRIGAALATQLELSEADAQSLLLASALYDVGKIAVPENVLRKQSPLTPTELDLVRRHAELGGVLIHHIPEFAGAAIAIYYHQERWDGAGYPEKLAGDAIPLLARVVALIDAYSAMISDRPYHKGMTPVEAIAELRRGSGTQFDPNLVERFVRVVITTGAD